MSEENFAAKSVISIHYIICECGETFPTENALKAHLEKEHPRKKERKEYRCGVCSAIYDTEDACIQHYEETHYQDGVPETEHDPSSEKTPEEIELANPENHYEELGTEYVDQEIEEEFVIEESMQGYDVEQYEVGEITEGYVNEEEIGDEVHLEGEFVDRGDIVDEEFDEVQVKEELEEGEIPLEEGEIPVFHIEMPKPRKKRGRRIVPKGRLPKGERTITCEVCGRRYASNAALRYHQRTHTGERPYKCHLCPKTFTMPLFLQIHVRCHTGERPFQCSHCEKAFSNKAALLRHDRVHTGEKPYKCPMCAKTFTQSNSMKLHVTTVHLKQPTPYKSKNRKARAIESTGKKNFKPNPRKKPPVAVDTVDILRNGLESYVLGPLKSDLEKFKSDIDNLTQVEYDSAVGHRNFEAAMKDKFKNDLEALQAVESIERGPKIYEVGEEILYDDEKGYCEVICTAEDVSSG